MELKGHLFKCLETAQTEIKLAGEIFNSNLVVADALTAEVILGLDFLEHNNCTIETGQRKLHFIERGISVALQTSRMESARVSHVRVTLGETVRVPASSELEVMARTSAPVDGGIWLLEKTSSERVPVMVARAVVAPNELGIPIRLLNTRTEAVTIHKGKTIATLEGIEECQIGAVREDTTRTEASSITQEKQQLLWEIVERIGEHLTEGEKEQLYILLLSYEDVFAASRDDFGRTGRIQHQINTGDTPPIRQAMRRIPPYQREGVRKLLQ